ncbi:SAM-dependent methyltransferase [Pseudodonghicola flavimaris]|uniref:Class I SAM-dependent methyltransferase n=1 Tax=Pseudodonghicola flavimaris TaxID=3050036 RepID=A0ABT7F181_9RHOB|nr:class I SAM-dependent methyltransferase [Pseudodonghicola flavimaris]MDK3018361.1 class I SAM-dependent methyltransferase [Pseudodonghicola flavimaris]
MWDQRYAQPGYLFGVAPAAFLADRAGSLAPGSTVLCVADGEGRNSSFLAAEGHRVTAFDASPVGLEKARGLAAERGVAVDYHLSGIEDWDWSQSFDVVVGIFIQFAAPAQRDQLFRWMAQAVAPGGLLLLHGYTPKQVEYGTGGPRDPSHMYTEEMLTQAFPGWELLRCAAYEREIDEGPGHSGRSALIDFIARKPL